MALTKRIIPCLDVKNGRVVKGLQFKSIVDAGDPVELAKRYSDEGADELVFLDITASDERRKTIKNLVKDVASVIDIPFTVGGGVSSLDDARNILLCGADKVGINTGAIQRPNVICELMDLFGRQCVVVAIDVKRNYDLGDNAKWLIDRPDDTCKEAPTALDQRVIILENDKRFWFEVFTYGGKHSTGIDAIQWAKKVVKLGAGEILLTSMDRDGTKDGYDTILVKHVMDSVSVPVVASGGCGHPSDMADIFKATDVDAALAASIFHYQSHGVTSVKKFLQERGISVRI